MYKTYNDEEADYIMTAFIQEKRKNNWNQFWMTYNNANLLQQDNIENAIYDTDIIKKYTISKLLTKYKNKMSKKVYDYIKYIQNIHLKNIDLINDKDIISETIYKYPFLNGINPFINIKKDKYGNKTDLKIISYNINGDTKNKLSPGNLIYQKLINEIRCDILLLSETQMSDAPPKIIGMKCIHYIMGKKLTQNSKRTSGGICIYVKDSLVDKISFIKEHKNTKNEYCHWFKIEYEKNTIYIANISESGK